MTNPTPAEIRHARIRAGLSKQEAAILVHSTYRAWDYWESESEDPKKHRLMHPGLWELFLIKVKKLG